MDTEKTFQLVVTILLAIVMGIAGWALRTVLALKGRVGSLKSQLDVMETRNKILFEGGDGQEGVLGAIRYLRNRVGWVGRAAHALRDRHYYVERELKLEGMPPLELPPE